MEEASGIRNWTSDKIFFFLEAMTSENKEDYFNSSKFVVDFVPQSSIFAKRKRRPSRGLGAACAG
jgi:hypothetical protein